ncbi:cell envelope-related transcriptional attenuator [Catenulispora acidiphila DSM 44928]|uniref:Cell envelope-related transcriptional attenuator n=1 Tax=Catenulispora acidiphila (strain DSM 44928 / JCM 14897 / NBRC 102108 / NRRL B-24433 / ID139908) TaxID=479433 RepID=C7QEE1_CATAD|nr:LCP family protein [Catenulispora acidiphila]ACU70832.1 cell envelope-related transcriptional attenuator [Catenulispora acidiphila DSM 44928]
MPDSTPPPPPRRPRPQPPYDLSPRGQGPRHQDDLHYWTPRPQQPERPAPPRRPAPEPPRRRRRRATIVARALACTTSAAIVLASAAIWAEYHNLTSGLLTSNAINEIRSGEKGYVAPHLDGSVNLLLIGLDSRKDMNGNDLPTDFVEQELHAGSSEIGGYNANVLIFLHIPADGGRVTAFSIARDDYVEEPGGSSAVGDIPDLGMHKIKEAYGRAKAIAVDRLKASGMTDQAQIEKVSREVGRESTIRAVQLLTGEHVDHLAEINLLGFYDVAQAVGPIEVCLNHPVNDPIEDGAGTGLKLPAGHSMLDAATALQFVRQRFHLLRGDFDRNRRQQAFLAAVMHKLKSEGVIGDLGKMQALFDVVKKDVVIDDSWDVLDFADRAQNLTGGNADFRELPITGQPVLPADGSVNTVNPLQIRQIVMTGFGDAKEFATEMAQATENGGDPASSLGPRSLTDPGAGLAQGGSVLPGQNASVQAGAAQGDGAPGALPPLPAARGGESGAGLGMRPAAIAPSDTHTVVDLYNATARNGLATTVGDWLAASGWPVDKTAGAAAQSRTTILYGKGAAKAAGQLAAALGVQALPAPSARTAAGHVLIRLGADYTPPGGPQPLAPTDATGPGPADPADPANPANPANPATADPSGSPDPADSPGIAMDSGITCVN